MSARVALSSIGQNGQYVGTTRVPTPTASPGSTTCRSFNGTSDRLILGSSSSLGSNFLAVMTFWRGESSVAGDNATAQRLFTQYCVGGTRVGVGINRSFLSLTYTDPSGRVYTVETSAKLLDVGRHFLAIEVTSTGVRIFLDGRIALKLTASLAAPDLARVCVGADTRTRFFKGMIDDLAVFQTIPGKTQNWLRYYRELVRGNYSRDYLAATFAAGFNSVTLSDDSYTAAGFSSLPTSRVAMATPWRAESELAEQYVEFKISAGSSDFMLGVIDSQHDLAVADIGTTAHSYAITMAGQVVSNNSVVASGLGAWSEANLVALGWKPATRTLSFWKDGTHVYDLNLPAETWTVALSLGTRTVSINSGQAVPFAMPTDTPGLPSKVWSKLTTEFRQMKLAEVSAPLDDTADLLTDAYTGSTVGSYFNPPALEAGFTVDPFDVSRRVGDGIKVNFGAYTAADDSFFFALAFCPEESDLVGEKVLLESPTKWGVRLVDGKLNAWVGSVQVGSINAPFTAGKRYILGLARSGAGKLLVWTHIGYILQSGDAISPQTATDVWVGSGATLDRKFSGRLSHLVLSSKLPDAWKMTRLKTVYSWDVPDVAGMIPNPSDVRQVFELSWRDVIASGLSATPNSANCYVGTVAKEPDAIAIEYRPVDRKGAAAFTGDNTASWAPGGALLQYHDSLTNQLYLTDVNGLSGVSVGSAALVGSEICRITGINSTTNIITVARGCADTVPVEHGAGTRVWFYDTHLGSSRNSYSVLDSVEVKMLSRSALAEMGEEFAPTDTLSMQGRLSRPYPPAGVTINELTSPEDLAGTVYIQWKHRNKVVQGGTLTGYFEADVLAAPAGVTYLVRAYNADTGELLHTSDPVAGTDHDYNLFVDGFTGNLKVTVSSVQGGLECLQVPSLTFAYTYQVTVLVSTEEGEPMETEGGDANLLVERTTMMLAGSFSGQLPDDWAGFPEEEEEEEEGGALLADGSHLAGVKFSEFGTKATALTGEEELPFAWNGTNYKITVSAFRDWLVANTPQAQDGKSAYQLWLDQGNTGSLDDFFEAYRGFRGLNSNSARRIQYISAASGAIICNWANFDEIRLTLTGNVTLTFQGAVDGQGCLLEFTQNSVGGHTVTLPSNLRWNNLIQRYDLTPTPGLSDKIGFIYDSGAGTYDFVTFVPGLSSS